MPAQTELLKSSTMASPDIRDRLILALDLPDAQKAEHMVETLGDSITFYKVGLQLFVAAGPAFVEGLLKRGKKVFLDLKYYDIPNTVAGAVKSAAALGVSMLTVHAVGGPKMLKAASEAVATCQNPPILLGVTVLTSISDETMGSIGIFRSVSDQVMHLAKLASESGCGGFVASPAEAKPLRKLFGPRVAIVVPGIRPAGADAGDQARIATPAEAIRNGASHIVVGRPITNAPHPAAAAKAILDEIRMA